MCGLQLLRAYTGLSRDSDAVTTALALNKYFPDDPEILYHTGRIYGNIAYIVMEKLHDDAPGSVWMLQAAGEAQESQKQFDLAITSFESVLRLEPRRPGVHYRMGRVYLARYQATHDDKDRDSAEAEFRAELGLDALHGNAAYELAQIHYEEGKLDEARAEFEALVERRPTFQQARVGLAGVLLESQKADLAVPQLKRALELDKEDEVAWYRMAQAMRAVGDAAGQKQAITEFKRVHAVQSRRRGPAGLLAPTAEVSPQQIGSTEP
jgi:predicted Zn-dependent protease